jgi:dolichol kinase
MNLWALFIPLIYYLLPSVKSSRLILLAVTSAFVVVDFFRLHITGFKEGFILFFGSFMRRQEFHRINGATYLMLGCLITALLFHKPVFVAAVTFIIVGDTFAALLGQTIKGPKLFHKTLVGSLSFLVSCVGSALLMHFFLNMNGLPLYILLIGAGSATVFEALPLPWDDNFSVPILAGAVMSLI